MVALRTLGLHPMTRALHNIVVTYLLTETHSGYDMPWMLHNVLPHCILGGSPAHEEHHHGGRHHFQQFFLYLDWLIGAIAGEKKGEALTEENVATASSKSKKEQNGHGSLLLRASVAS